MCKMIKNKLPAATDLDIKGGSTELNLVICGNKWTRLFFLRETKGAEI